jgi:hypothetical protein
MKSSEKYRELTLRLLDDMAWGTLSEDEDEAIREEMDALWTQMSDQEQREADEWLAAERRKAPEDLGLEEPPGDELTTMHRRPRAA